MCNEISNKTRWYIPSASRGGREAPEIFPCAPDGGNVWSVESTNLTNFNSFKNKNYNDNNNIKN